MLSPILHSLFIATFATLLGFFISLPLAYQGAFKNFKGKSILEIILLLPIILPPTIIGLILLQIFGKYGCLGNISAWFNYSLIFTLNGAMLATTIVILPLLYQGLKGAFFSVSPNLIAAGKTLRATPCQILFKIILPQCWPGIIASLLLAFCRALGEFGASLMVAGYIEGKTDTIATSIYFAVQQGKMQRAIWLSTFNILLGIFVLAFIQLLTKKNQRRSL